MLCTVAVGAAGLQAFEEPPTWSFAGDLAERATANAALLASEQASGLVAEPAAVAARAADLAAIYAMDGGLAAAEAERGWADSVLLWLGPETTVEEVLARLPAEWAAEARASEWGDYHAVFIRAARVHAPHVADWLAAQPGVERAEPNWTFGGGADLEFFPACDLYVFSLGWGDCPSGCIYRDFRYVVMTTEGPVRIEAEEAFALRGGLPRTPVRAEIRASRLDALQAPADLVAYPFAARLVRTAAEAGPFGAYTLEVRGEKDERPFGRLHYDFRLVERGGPELLAGERMLSGWLLQPDFGWLWDQAYPWIWHPDHGWLYVGSAVHDPFLWVYDAAMGWSFWSPEVYPWIYAGGRWLYYREGSRAPRRFYDPSRGGEVEVD